MTASPHCAVVCAAGAGTRMGTPKALCLLDSRSFLQSIVETLHHCRVQKIVVVVGAHADQVVRYHLERGLNDVTFVSNPRWQSTYMLESLLCGLQHVPPNYAVLHWPVDCVDVHTDDLNALLARTEPLSSLVYDGVPAHPMRISPEAVQHLIQNVQTYSSLRDLVAHFGVTPVPTRYDALMNCNTPERLQEYVQNSLIRKVH